MHYRLEWTYWEAEREVTGDWVSIYALVVMLADNHNITKYRVMKNKYPNSLGPVWEKVEDRDFGWQAQKGDYNV